MRAGTVVADRFETLGLAGHGGMGSVYKARDRATGDLVALKILRARDPAAEQRLVREARILADLAHPSIVRYVSHGVAARGGFYLVMEWLPGETLAARLANGPLTHGEALAVGYQVSDALHAAHLRGVVHRDVKPSNIVIGPRSEGGRVKLLDFGVAHLRAAVDALTTTGATLGTPGYMAPEQARGEPSVDPRADVFSLGAVLFQALSGRLPFVGEDAVATLLAVENDPAPRLSDLVPDADPSMDALLARMLAKDPAERPRNGGAVRDALMTPLEDERTIDSAPPSMERPAERDHAARADRFEREGDLVRAAEAYRLAAEHALDDNDFAAAIERAERSVRCGASGEALGVARRIQAEAHGFTDDHFDAIVRAREAMALLPKGSPSWCVSAVEVIRGSAALLDHDQLLSAASEIGSLDFPAPSAPHVTAAARAASYLYATDHRDEAEWILDRAERFAEHPGAADAASLPWLHHARSWKALFDGDPVASLRHEERATEGFDRNGDVRSAVFVRVGLGHAYRDVGDLARAEIVLREVLPAAARWGLQRLAHGAKHTLATVLGQRGRYAEAIAFAEDAIAGFVEDGNVRLTGAARAELSRILAAAGDLTRAESEARAAADVLSNLKSAQAYALGVLAYVKLLSGKPAEALTASERAMAIIEEVGAIQDGDIMVRLAHAESLYALGSMDAESTLRDVRTRLLASASRITDVALRLSFLENIPENARTMALCRLRLPVNPARDER
ncbi:MAG: protein kinase [Polyangiaceae bacterium]